MLMLSIFDACACKPIPNTLEMISEKISVYSFLLVYDKLDKRHIKFSEYEEKI
jgi:hypothetical protein